jgi:hypothetical protein
VNSTRLQRAGALLLATALLLAAVPAAAAPPERGVGEARGAPSLFDALAAWLASLWPGSGPGSTLAAGWQALGGEPDSNGETTPRDQHGPGLDPMGEPTPQPQHGPDLDPYG